MDDTEDDARYPPNNQQDFGSSNRQKLPVRNAPYSREVGDQYIDVDDDEDENEEEEEEEEEDHEEEEMAEEDRDTNQNNGILYEDEDDDNDEDIDDEDEGEDDDEKNLETIDDEDSEKRHQKKRKMKSLVSSYEFAPRVPAAAPATTKPSFVGRNPLTDWTENETFVLLDAWGEKFLQRGRKSLRSEEWHEVAEKVSEVSNIERTDTQCRNRLDTLKKKYKKEKSGSSGGKWVYFRKMDMLLSPSGRQQGGLSCGMDSGDYVFMNPKVYLNRANGLDKMKDSPENSESAGEEDDDSDGLPPKKRRSGRDRSEGSSIRVLAESIHRFSEIYEKIESSKRQQMLELEKMRMDFHKELEMQKRQIMERAQAEIANIRQGGEEENHGSG